MKIINRYEDIVFERKTFKIKSKVNLFHKQPTFAKYLQVKT